MAGERLREYALTSAELGAVAAQTVMVAVLPVLLAQHGASSLAIGFAIGGEGVFALLLPFWAGAVTDRVPPGIARRFGRRMVVAAPAALLLAGSVTIAPFLPGYWPVAIAALVSFAALHAFLTPFWTLLIDDVPEQRRGRVQGIRVVFRAIGLAYGLVGAALLFSAWHPLPFIVASALALTTTAVTWRAARHFRFEPSQRRRGRLRDAWTAIAARPAAVWLLVADAFWTASVDGIRPYFFLFARHTLGLDVGRTSVGLAVLVLGVGVGASFVGRLGDRYDRHRILEVSSLVLALTFVAGFAARDVPVALCVAAVAGVAAAGVMTLPYPLFSSLVDDRSRGESTGIYETSVTVGRIFSPIAVGGVITIAARWMPRYGGYPAMWLVSAALAAAGWYCVRRSPRGKRGAIAGERTK